MPSSQRLNNIEENINKRVLEFMQAINISATEFAKQLGVSKALISHIKQGRNKPSLNFVVKLISAFPELNPEWLLLGKGSMFKEGKEPSLLPFLDKKSKEQESKVSEKEEIKEQQEIKEPESKQVESISSAQAPAGQSTPFIFGDDFPNGIVIFYPDKTFEFYKQRNSRPPKDSKT